MKKNIFVVGFDEFNYSKLNTLRNSEHYTFHSLLDVKEVKRRESYAIEDLLGNAEAKLNSFSGTIDAIVGYWDFPVTCLAPFLSHKRGLPAPPLESVLKCSHKYWSRFEQRKVIKEHPNFCAVNPFDEDAFSKIGLPFPFWLKPVKAFASQLGFRIHNAGEFQDCLPLIRQGIGLFSHPFNFFLNQVEMPPELAEIDGSYCIAEEIVSGRQCTLEGYVWDGKVEIFGVVDSIREPNRSTFSRYQYPSKLPRVIQERMAHIATTVMRHIQFNSSPFNIEFFYDTHNDTIWLLEINPRISQSHCDLFEKVDGASHHEVMIALALGEKPDLPYREGRYPCAAKFFLRTHEDALVKRVPSIEDIQRVKEMFPGTLVHIHVKEGMRLSELLYQESYSYELGFIYMGAATQHELLANHEKCLAYLPFELIPLAPENHSSNSNMEKP